MGVRVELSRVFVVEFDMADALITFDMTRLLWALLDDAELVDEEAAHAAVSTANKLDMEWRDCGNSMLNK